MSEPLLARFHQRLNGALMQLKVMPRWLWPAAMYDLVWPVIRWEIVTQSEPDSTDLIQALGDTPDADAAVRLLCDYLEKKLQEASNDTESL